MGQNEADRLAARLTTYRVFADDAGKMNRSVREVGGAVLLVPQFTLAADTSERLAAEFLARRRRPSRRCRTVRRARRRASRPRTSRTPAAASAPTCRSL